MMKQIAKQPSSQLSINQNSLKGGETYNIEQYILKDSGLYMNVKDKEKGEMYAQKISESLFVKETVQNLDTKDVYMNLCYKFKGKYHEIAIGMGQLVPNELMKLSSKGMDISYEYHKYIATFLREQQKCAPHKEIYREVGWHEDEEENLVFRHHHILSKRPDIKASNDTEGGSYNLEPQGSLNVWKGMIFVDVGTNIPLQTILCIGFSAPLVGYLSTKYDDVDTLLFHLVGDSTKGKTTAALLAVSPFGMPSNKKKGLMKSWNGTSNATINMMAGNYGIPLVLDELSMSSAKSLTSEIYVLTNGQEKSRLNDEMKQRKQGTWSTTIISTGEQSIFERTNQNIGLTVRAFEFSNISWTTSAENADAIRSVIQDDYGYAGEAFIKSLFEIGLPIMEEKWAQWQERCVANMPDTPFRTRIAKKIAIVLAAGELANESLELLLDLEQIMHFLLEQEMERMTARDIGKKAINFLIQLFIQHQTNFRTEKSFSSPMDCWGKVFVHSDFIEVAFLKNILEQELRKGGYDDPKVVIRNWKEKGWLITEGDRPTKRTRVFEKDEQDERKTALGMATIPRKWDDTTYNIKIPRNTLEDMMSQETPVTFQEVGTTMVIKRHQTNGEG
jgi:putative DNA primase/helicase